MSIRIRPEIYTNSSLPHFDFRDRLKESQMKLQTLQRLGAKIAESDLSELIQESAVLQATRVLYGDYNLKIMRQDYFTSKQDQVSVHKIG